MKKLDIFVTQGQSNSQPKAVLFAFQGDKTKPS